MLSGLPCAGGKETECYVQVALSRPLRALTQRREHEGDGQRDERRHDHERQDHCARQASETDADGRIRQIRLVRVDPHPVEDEVGGVDLPRRR